MIIQKIMQIIIQKYINLIDGCQSKILKIFLKNYSNVKINFVSFKITITIMILAVRYFLTCVV